MKLNNIFSDGMILQRGKKINIFGTAYGECVITFDGNVAKTHSHGKFCVTFPEHEAGGPYTIEACCGNEKTVINEVMVGEVIFAAGQSNMELTVAETHDAKALFEGDEYIRFFNSSRPVQPSADDYFNYEFGKGGYYERWVSLTSGNASEMSAIALHTAIYYRKKYNVAIGVICCFKGATVIQTFLSKEANLRFPYDKSKMHYDHGCGWNKPALFYEKMLLPVFPYGVGRAVFYQGESNRSLYEAAFYADMLKEFIHEIRVGFSDNRLKTAVVQINKYPVPCEEGVEAIRRAQEVAVAETDNCVLIRIDDMGEHELIHPKNKREVARRITEGFELLESEEKEHK